MDKLLQYYNTSDDHTIMVYVDEASLSFRQEDPAPSHDVSAVQ